MKAITKYFLYSSAVVIVGSGIYFMRGVELEILQEKKILNDGGMSARAEEYVKKKQREGAIAWNVSTDDGAAPVSRIITVDGCLTMKSPFIVKSVKKQEGCNVFVSTSEPTGGITIYHEALNPDWQDVSHISMRRQDTTRYSEDSYISGGKEYLLFSVNDQFLFQKTAFIPIAGKLFAITMDISTSQQYSDEFSQLLDSIEWVES